MVHLSNNGQRSGRPRTSGHLFQLEHLATLAGLTLLPLATADPHCGELWGSGPLPNPAFLGPHESTSQTASRLLVVGKLEHFVELFQLEPTDGGRSPIGQHVLAEPPADVPRRRLLAVFSRRVGTAVQ